MQTPGIYLENILGLKYFSFLRVFCVYKECSNKSYTTLCNDIRAFVCTSIVSFINFNSSVTLKTFLVLFASVLGRFPVIVNTCVPGLLLLFSSLYLSKKLTHFAVPEAQFPCLKQPGPSPDRASDKSCPHPYLPISVKSILMLSLDLSPSLISNFFSLVFPIMTFMHSIFAIRATCPAHRNLLD